MEYITCPGEGEPCPVGPVLQRIEAKLDKLNGRVQTIEAWWQRAQGALAILATLAVAGWALVITLLGR